MNAYNEVSTQEELVSSFYEDGCCPDCGEEILDTAVAGDSCKNCGHVFNTYQPFDDEQKLLKKCLTKCC